MVRFVSIASTALALTALLSTAAAPAWAEGKVNGVVNVNTASYAVLSAIPGIGPDNAASLIAYRAANPDQLTTFAAVAVTKQARHVSRNAARYSPGDGRPAASWTCASCHDPATERAMRSSSERAPSNRSRTSVRRSARERRQKWPRDSRRSKSSAPQDIAVSSASGCERSHSANS